MAIRLVVVPTGRIARHVLVGLHVAKFIQSALLRLPTRFWIRPARRRFDVLLLVNPLLYPAVIQGHNAIGDVQRWQSPFQQHDHVVSTAP